MNSLKCGACISVFSSSIHSTFCKRETIIPLHFVAIYCHLSSKIPADKLQLMDNSEQPHRILPIFALFKQYFVSEWLLWTFIDMIWIVLLSSPTQICQMFSMYEMYIVFCKIPYTVGDLKRLICKECASILEATLQNVA